MGSDPTLPVVLLVEDNPDDALLTNLTLDEAGIANPVVHVEDGLDALDRLRAGGVALVLLDLRLPRLDGAGVLAALRDDPPPQRPPVFVLAASTDSTASLGVPVGDVAAVLVKPMGIDELVAALATLTTHEVVVRS